MVSQALKLLFHKDVEFIRWQANTPATTTRSKSKEGSYKDCLANMKSRPTQFGVRENTTSSRQHASRLAMNASVLQSDLFSATEQPDESSNKSAPPIGETFELSLTEQDKGTTGGGETRNLTSGLSGGGRRPTVERPLTAFFPHAQYHPPKPGKHVPFISTTGGLVNLNTLIPSGTGFILTDAIAINDSGEILCDATNSAGGSEHAVLLKLK